MSPNGLLVPEAGEVTAERFAARLSATSPDLCVATPCGVLGPLLSQLERMHDAFAYVHREDNAVALAAGTALAGGGGLVLMQNSGFGQAVNVLASLVEPFHLPIGFVISMRGTGGDTTRENQSMGRVTEPVLDELGIPYRLVRRGHEEEELAWFETLMAQRTDPAALLIPPELFGWSASQ